MRAGDAGEYMGRGLACAEEVDRMDARGGRAGNAYAGGSGAVDALGISYGANVFVAFVSDAVFHGRKQPLSVFEHGGAVGRQGRKILHRVHGEEHGAHREE